MINIAVECILQILWQQAIHRQYTFLFFFMPHNFFLARQRRMKNNKDELAIISLLAYEYKKKPHLSMSYNCKSNTTRAELYYSFSSFVRLPCKRVSHVCTKEALCCTASCYALVANSFYIPSMCEVFEEIMVGKDFNRWRDLYKL